MSSMSFLDNFSFQKSTQSTYTEEAEETPTDTPSDTRTDTPADTPFPSRKGKRRRYDDEKLMNLLQARASQREQIFETTSKNDEDSSNPIITFCKSIALTLKKLDKDLICDAKARISNIVYELEIKCIERRRSNQGNV